ncbi:nucleotidyl-sugar pyranose mutase [Campylobacter lari]|nr:nucleotidyl-sugar pyranose mutase [Campylobacter lari]EAJ8706391.1 nucleotidyl-sugar pyranose mutase [Campylobacter jejuni]EAL0060413.1 nucleotidyl-sugar pyranose mutase [Campylobacter lari]ECL4969367.1 nucleotidyl-sugar pyranose mutase [Campylobacter lari]EHL5011045.1 NAD(P)-binding protein [Campylobacter lari]
MKIAVIGAGISGMSVARLLKDDFEVEVLEKESVVGGIARTKEVNGIAYHVNGGHCFTTRYNEVKDFVFKNVLAEDQWNRYVKDAKILFKNYWISNPIENSVLEIDKFDPNLAFQITKEMFSASYEKGRNLEEWFINHFGPTLAKEYFIPYNTKIWGIEPKNMDSIWTVDDKQMKLPIPTKENFYNSLVNGKGVDGMVEASGYYYPKTNNQNTFIEAIGKGVNILLEYPVKSIEKKFLKWIINGEKEYDLIINTSPLDMLVDILSDVPNDIQKHFRNLKFNRVSNVLCETDGSVDFTWAYIPDKDIGIHRTINIGTFFTPNKNYCLAERMGSHSIEYFEKEIKKLPYLKNIVGHNITEHAYILFDLNYKQSKEEAIKYLNSLNIISHGRFGEWEYYNMDVCMKRSLDLATKLKNTKGIK